MLNLKVIEREQQRVLTTQQLAEAYEVETRRISENFNANKGRYVHGKHFYLIEGEELKEFRDLYGNSVVVERAPKLYLWTERGALLHAKSLNTDVAWQVYDRLVESYFNSARRQLPQGGDLLALAVLEAKRMIEEKDKIIEEQRPKAVFADAVSASKDTILVGELAKLLNQNGIDTGEKRLYNWLRENGYLIKRKGTDYNMPTQYSMERGLFVIKETAITHSDGAITVRKTPKVTGKGQNYFINQFLENVKLAIVK